MNTPDVSRSARYRIRVRGQLNQSWSDLLGGMEITVEHYEFKKPISILMGRLRDQASLAGILNSLHDMRFAVLSVEQLED